MVVPLGPAATAPTRTAAFVIAHSSATPIGTRSLKPALEISGSYRKRPRREASSPTKRTSSNWRSSRVGAMAEVAANSRSDSLFPKNSRSDCGPRPKLHSYCRMGLVGFRHPGDVNQERISVPGGLELGARRTRAAPHRSAARASLAGPFAGYPPRAGAGRGRALPNGNAAETVRRETAE